MLKAVFTSALFVLGLGGPVLDEIKETVNRYDHEIHGVGHMTTVMKLITEDRVECRLQGLCPTVVPSVVNQQTNCVDGVAGEYACNNVNMLSFISLADLGYPQASGNDIWGWQSPDTARYYAIVGTTEGTTFVDISDPVNPVVIGSLDSNVSPQITWRDMKIYNGYAYIVADDYLNAHGMQVVNLKALDNNQVDLVTVYTDFGSCHNIVIDEDSGYAYAVGTRTCSGGLHQVDIRDPANPTYAGCFNSDGYTHDAECVYYDETFGPELAEREICFNYNEDTLTIVDTTDKENPNMLSRTGYSFSAYTHQGWLNNDRSFLVFNDELDEQRNGFNTRTHVFSLADLSNPTYEGYFQSPFPVIDHNLYYSTYLGQEYIFMANYEAGLVIYRPNSDYTSVEQVGYFDTYPSRNSRSFNGAWSNYPFWVNQDVGGYRGVVIVQDINRGFYVLQYNPLIGDQTVTIPLTSA